MKLLNLQTQQVEDTNPDDAFGKVFEDTHALVDATADVKDPDGNVSKVEAKDVPAMIKQGYTFTDPVEAQKQVDEQEFGSPSAQLETIGQGITSGATMGLDEVAASVLQKNTGIETLDVDRRKKLAATNPIARGIGEALGTGGAILAGGVLPALKYALPTLWVDSLASRVGGAGAAKVASNFAKTKVGVNVGLQTATGMGVSSVTDDVRKTVLENKEFNAQSVLANATMKGLIGGVLGFGAGVVGKGVYDKVKQAYSKADASILKAGGIAQGMIDEEIKPNQLFKSRIPGSPDKRAVIFKSNADAPDLMEYADKTRNVFIDPKKISGQVLDITDPNATQAIAKRLENPDLPRLFNPERAKKIGPEREIQEIAELYLPPIDQATKDLIGNSTNKKAQNLLYFIESRDAYYDDILAKGILSDADKKALQNWNNEVIGKVKELASSKLNLSEKGIYKNILSYYKSNQANRLGLAKKYSNDLVGYSDGGSLFITKPEALEEAMAGGKRIWRDRFSLKDIKKSSQYQLKFIGAQLKELKGKVPLEDLEAVADYAGKKLVESDGKKHFLPSVERLSENIQRDLQENNIIMNDSLAKLENILEKKYGTDVYEKIGMNSDKIAKHIEGKWLSGMRDEVSGEIKAEFAPLYEKVKDFAATQRVERQVMKDGVRTYPAYTPSEIRQKRINLDKTVKDFFGDLEVPDQMKVELRNYLEGHIEDVALKSDLGAEGEALIKAYKQAKRDTRVALLTNDMVTNQLARDLKNNAVPLTGYIAGSAALAGGNPATGAAVMAARKTFKDYGDYFMAKTYEKLGTDGMGIAKTIGKTASDFVGAVDRPIVAAVINASAKYEPDKYFEKEAAQIRENAGDLQAYGSKFDQNNPALRQFAPEVADAVFQTAARANKFLAAYLPKNPYANQENIDWKPSYDQIASYERAKKAVTDPKSVLANFSNGYLAAEEINALKQVYPEIYNKLKTATLQNIQGKKLPYQKRQLLQRVFGINLDYSRPVQVQQQEQAMQSAQPNSSTRKTNRKLSGQAQTENERILSK